MRIQRRPNRGYHRSSRRRGGGKVSLLLLFGALAGMLLLARDWLAARLAESQPGGATLALALGAFEQGRLDVAIQAAARLLEEDPDDLNAARLLVRALIYRSFSDYDSATDRQQALRVTQALVRRMPRTPEALGLHAFALHANGYSNDASRTALLAIERNPQDVPARISLALAYGAQALFEASLREAQRAVELADAHLPDWGADARRTLAIAYSDLGRYTDALSAIDGAIARQRRILPFYFERALYALQLGDKNAATAAYFQVITFDPQNAKAHLRLCEISSRLREREAALRYCGKAVEFASTWADAWYQLGLEQFLQGDLRAAQQSLGRCSTLQTRQNVPIEQRRFECWYLQGQAAEVLGDCDGLRRIYGEFLAMSAAVRIPQTWVYPPEGPPACPFDPPLAGAA